MASLQDIDVRVESPAIAGDATHNFLPVLHELRHALMQLCETGEPTIIDLTAMPFGPDDQARLLEALGTGEVTASVHALGVTAIKETAFSGVWLVEHRSVKNARLALHIEVAEVPSLLRTPKEDLDAASRRLEARVSALAAGEDQSVLSAGS